MPKEALSQLDLMELNMSIRKKSRPVFLNKAKTNCINLFVKPCTKHQEKIKEDEGQTKLLE